MYDILQLLLHRAVRTLIGLAVAIGAILLAMGGPVSAAKGNTVSPLASSAINYPVIFIHGFDPYQGSGRGTQWTLLGSSTLQGVSCDLTVHPESALYMDSWVKIVYVSPCYGHGDMLRDTASSNDATVYYCHNCTKEDALNWRNWSSTSSYSHALRMLLSVF